MKKLTLLLAILTIVTACNSDKKTNEIEGTWRLIAEEITQNDSTYSTFNPNTKMIKIINNSHFAFFNHDLHNGKDSLNALFFSGGGRYTLKDSVYTEYLEYFNNRQWENNTFEFVVKVKNDTLTQTGRETLEDLGINRIINEKYVREKN